MIRQSGQLEQLSQGHPQSEAPVQPRIEPRHPAEHYDRLFGSICSRMQRLVRTAKEVAANTAPLVIFGEPGVGKTTLGSAIHQWGERQGPFVTVTGTLVAPDHLLTWFSEPEQSIFPNGSTVLFRRLDALSLPLQTALLHQVQPHMKLEYGGLRVMVSANESPEHAIRSGHLSEALFDALGVFSLEVPPLRERVEDIPEMSQQLLDRLHSATGAGPWTLGSEGLASLLAYAWPGNVRELINVLERAVLSGEPGQLTPDVPSRRRRRKSDTDVRWPTLEEYDRRYIRRVLRHSRGRIYGKGGAAAVLGLPPTTLQSRMAKLGISRHEEAQRASG